MGWSLQTVLWVDPFRQCCGLVPSDSAMGRPFRLQTVLWVDPSGFRQCCGLTPSDSAMGWPLQTVLWVGPFRQCYGLVPSDSAMGRPFRLQTVLWVDPSGFRQCCGLTPSDRAVGWPLHTRWEDEAGGWQQWRVVCLTNGRKPNTNSRHCSSWLCRTPFSSGDA